VDFGRYFWLSPPSDDISLGGALLKASRRLLGSSRSTNGVDPFSTFYPTSGGFGEFCDRLSNAFLAAGGETRTQSGIESLGLDDGRIRTVAVGGEQLPVDWVIWTGDLPSLGRLLNLPVLPSIDHLYLALFHFEVAGPRAHDYLWVDFTEPDMLVHRASYNNINRPRNAPPGCHGITAEVACRVDDEVWRSPDHFIGAVRDQLIATGFVRSADGILACHVERVPRAWPLLGLDYREHAENLLRRVKERAANLSATYRPGESLPTVDRVLQRAFDVSNDVRQQLGIGEAVSMRT
jgi:protoporphyrinogen oxidase